MPCDSAGAGLVALGWMIQDMASPKANDVDGHYDALRRYALQYLKACRVCDMCCNPQSKRCGYTLQATGRIRHTGGQIYTVSERSELIAGNIWFLRKGVNQWLNPRYATEWQIDGEPTPQLVSSAGALPLQIYTSIVSGAAIVPDNLRKSFSGLCLAGRAAGQAASRDAFSSIRFRVGDAVYSLPELLAVYRWNRDSDVSRITFFNARTEQIDRSGYAPALVVADGEASFLKVLDRPEFQRSDVIGVIHRAIDRENLEQVGNRILGLYQWYAEDVELMNQLPEIPKGISAAILRRRSS